MQIIKEKIRFNNLISGGTMNLSFPLQSNDGFNDYQQEVDNLTEFVSLDLVNPVTDLEKRRFKSFNTALLAPKLTFEFYSIINVSGVDYSQYFSPPSYNIGLNMFTNEEITSNSDNWLNSFFIMDFYDSYDINNQTKLFTTYLTKKGVMTTSTVTINLILGLHYTYTVYNAPTPVYTIDNSNQLYYWYVPISYLDTFTGNTKTGWVKFSFYNAKTGKLQLFFNKDYEGGTVSTTPQKMFFQAELNKLTKTWKFSANNNVNAKEFISSAAYITKVNNTVNKVDDLQQNPPSGNTFTYTNGKATYETI